MDVSDIKVACLSDIDKMVAQIELDDIPGVDDYNEEDTEEWGAMVDDSRNQDLGVTEVPEVNIQEALLRTEEQKKDLEMKNAKKLEKDRIVRISQKKRRIRYTAPGKYCKLCIFIVVLVIVLHVTFVIYLISLMFELFVLNTTSQTGKYVPDLYIFCKICSNTYQDAN